MKVKLFMLFLIIGLLAGCGAGNVTSSVNGEGENANPAGSEETAETADAVQEETNETVESSEEEQVLVENEQNGFKKYRAPSNVTKVFKQDEFEIYHDIIDQNENFVQELTRFGDAVTLNIFKWTEEEMSNVYKEENPQSTQSMISNFQTVESPSDAMSLTRTGMGDGPEWEVIAQNEEITVPYAAYTEVLVMKQTISSEASDQKTVTTRYYAPNVGLIKETIETDGENATVINTELSNITELAR
ncbi:hypothetical protein [Jeotgalibacillus soli]|uniref:Uncharacterized protein n=1 Tax=Jeotgalibacillus soli TaxID=889306 RepID=A0A0C2VZT5_9BACL|nr:hypothetical protein [Jeotgalibacillus soli]KIL49881.1 hypothetical protein KP78_13490 [Jeotgalibacillus soli]